MHCLPSLTRFAVLADGIALNFKLGVGLMRFVYIFMQIGGVMVNGQGKKPRI